MTVLAEQFVRDESDGRVLPLEYNFYSFNGHIAAVGVRARKRENKSSARLYTPQWELFDDPIWANRELDIVRPPPRCLEEMLDMARRLGAAYGIFVRIDLFASDQGGVFGEFSATPSKGRGFTPFANASFNELWEKHCPGTV